MTSESLEIGKEYPPEGEELLIEEILKISQFSMEHKPHPPTPRDQHPKSHGYLEGEFTIEENIPDNFKIGVFTEPKKTYPIWIRFSNGGSDRGADGNFLPDTTGDVRGMAIKLMGVRGEMAIDDPSNRKEQDFVLINHPTFFIRDVRGYIDFFSVVKAMKEGKITFNPDGTPNGTDELLAQFRAIGSAFPILKNIKAKSTPSPLEISYWSSTPYRFGGTAMKFSVVPNSANRSFNPENAIDKSNYLREAMTQYLADKDAYFDFKIQLQTDASTMPVEDPTVEWDEQESPYIKVATIKIPWQNFNTLYRKQLDEKQSFSPWHSLREHQPLGGVNRARKIYIELAKVRNNLNREFITDPSSNTIVFVETANELTTTGGSELAAPSLAPRRCRPFSLSIMVFSPESGYKFEIEIEKSCTATNEAVWKFVFMLYKKNGRDEFDTLVQIKFTAATPEESQGIAEMTRNGLSDTQLDAVNDKVYPITKSLGDEGRNPTPAENQILNSSMREIVLN
jgi:Catalase